ncbi:tRNA (guanine(37)-N1)-methyltransferase isoform X2 [Salmo salar]|uniref:tRNA (guanine(37)-N1)-methyltransferase n=1 Tax=Salmo salar TaxID=8030 RepID=A0A1S3R0D0_SALSA|nr:tRNA (guanine(37)-N1)-methyltransferase isoform X2 [Salmo salar]
MFMVLLNKVMIFPCNNINKKIVPSIFSLLQIQNYVKSRYRYRTLCSVVLQPDRASTCSESVSKPMLEQHQHSGMDPSLYTAPPEVRGMTCLDKEVFSQTVIVPALRVPKEVLNKLVKSLKKVALQRPGIRRVVEVEGSDDDRLLLLDPASVSSPGSFSDAEAEALQSFGIPQELQRYELRLTYDNLKSEEVLRAVLPEGQDVTSGFSRVGHIAHMNLREHQLPYRNLIGQVIMDKNPGVTCVVNKTNTIDSAYRNFKMEVMAGEENMVAKVRENGVTYEFDFSRVYWNPRLSTEHERVVALLKRGDTVLDVFAGVGPFAIPAARRGCTVLANDLNPESHRWLQHNCKLNKVERKVTTFNLDGRAFIHGPLKQQLPVMMKGTACVHVVMNLPALALEFLDAFRGLLDQGLSCDVNLPQVHCYGFSKEDDPQKDVVERASASLGFSLEGLCSVHLVRNVAPNKEMMCVSFTIPKEVLFSRESTQTEAIEEPAPKRQRCEATTN